MTETERSILLGQAQRDTIYCELCTLRGISRRAAVRYTVSAHGITHHVCACHDCFRGVHATQSIPLVASEPVMQPAHIGVIEGLLLAAGQGFT